MKLKASSRVSPLPALVALISLFAACLPATAFGAKRHVPYMYQVDVAQDVPITLLRIADIWLPDQVKLQWTPIQLYNGPANCEIQRGVSGTYTSIGSSTTASYQDTYAYSSGVQYQYRVRVTAGQDIDVNMHLPSPPACADPAQIYYHHYTSGNPWSAINITAVKSSATDNQTADSRYDLRYSTYVFKDFQFGTRTYRGGLFAGYAADSARVGRSFLKFQLPTIPSGQDFWTGTVNAWFTQNAANGSATIGCQSVSSNWDQGSLKWSTSPVVQGPVDQMALSYDGTTGSAKWAHWNMAGDICSAAFGTGLVSFALFSTSETTNGWAYFAKTEWQLNPNGPRSAMSRPPQVVYAYGGPLWAIDIYVEPTNPVRNSTATGTVFISAPAPTGGAVVTLTSSSPSVASVPSSVTIPAGSVSANFTVTTGFVYQNTNATITGSYGGMSQTFVVTVRPN